MNSGVDLSCAKKIIISAPHLADCNPDQDYDAGLCYPKCTNNMTGVGPVCWGSPPANWVNCGMGAAKDSSTCVNKIFDNVVSVGSMAANVASKGMGAAASVATKATKATKIIKQLNKIVESSEQVKRTVALATQQDTKEVAGLKGAVNLLKSDSDPLSPE